MEDTASGRCSEVCFDDNNKSGHKRARPTTPVRSSGNLAASVDRNANPKEDNATRSSKSKHADPQVLRTRRQIQLCCANNDLASAILKYEDAIANDVKIEAQSFYNLLNLCINDHRPNAVHIGTPKHPKGVNQASEQCDRDQIDEKNRRPELTMQQKREHAFRLKSDMDSLHLPLNETAYTALIRICCQTRDTATAESLLRQAMKSPHCKPKLRMFSSLLLAHCQSGDMTAALHLRDTFSKQSIAPTEREYCALIQCAVKVGDTSVMEGILSDLAEHVLVPSTHTVNAIISWFQSPHATTTATQNNNIKVSEKAALPIRGNVPTMGSVTSPYPWKVSRGCTVDSMGVLQSGCLAGTQLLPVPLSDKAWKEMMDMNEILVLKGVVDGDTSQFAGGGKGKKRTNGTEKKRAQTWESFQRCLHHWVGPPQYHQTEDESLVSTLRTSHTSLEEQKRTVFDVVIDGANVGYYKQNFANAPRHVDYVQIDWMVQHFVARQKFVLLVLHERHFSPQLMPLWATSIVHSWDNNNNNNTNGRVVLYRAPAGSNDDWFWMHAALWCGRNTVVVSNDEMRDHHFQMLNHGSFVRWKERHQVHFHFGIWSTDDPKRREVELKYPDVYSRRIQRIDEHSLAIPLVRRGDENRFLDGAHMADDEHTPTEETYVCICTNPPT